ncbi:DUF1700 domain-containing protein [Caldalkalibacillus mannanilyticus]|uniref:DUF1700 domain-containing protein n=1 Tax=Caldalkalibacillus mannanilyticus TaxID=1418 RepID=UPI00046B04FB|nr:DUF1700 domain-containing protein [Caldalkalibacillus mannanilyticus]
MNKSEFLAVIEQQLQAINKEDLQELLDDYESHFELGRQNGKSEEEIVGELGDPKELVQEFWREHEEGSTETTYSESQGERHFAEEPKKSGGQMVLTLLGLLFLNLLFVLPLGLSIWVLWFSLFLAGIAMFAAPVLFVIDMILYQSFFLGKLFLTMIIFGLGVFMVMGTWYSKRGLQDITRRYINWNKNVLGG